MSEPITRLHVRELGSSGHRLVARALPDPAPAASGLSIGHNIGAGRWHKLKMDPTDSANFTRDFGAFKAALAAEKEGGIDVATITNAVIYFSRGYISYQVQGRATPTIITISKAETVPALKQEIDKIKAVTEKVWGNEISILTYKDGAMGPYCQNQPILGSASDPTIRAKVFPQEKDVIAFLLGGPKYPTGAKLNEYCERLATAKHMKKRLKTKVTEKIQALKADELRAAAAHEEGQQKTIKAELLKLRILQGQLNDDWEETTLPIVLAYKYQYEGQIAAGTKTPLDVANEIERDLTAHYKKMTKPSKFKSFFGKTPPPMSTFPTDVARQFLAAYQPDVDKGRKDYTEFCLSHGDGMIKSEVFADTFTRYLISDSFNEASAETTFTTFIEKYLGDQISDATKHELSIQIDPVDEEIQATSNVTQASINQQIASIAQREASIVERQRLAELDGGELL